MSSPTVPTLVEIRGLAAGGRGVARQDGRVWFVRGALPGDEVLAVPERARLRYVEARCVEIVRPSPSRRPPACPIQGRCGGCPWMPLPESAQREWKTRIVTDALSRIGGVGGLRIEDLRSPGEPLGYRNRIELTLVGSATGAAPLLGLHGSPAGIVDVDRCLLQSDAANEVLSTIRGRLTDAAAAGRPLRGEYRLTIRRSGRTGEMLVVIRENGVSFPAFRQLARTLLREHREVVGVVQVRGREGHRGGARAETVAGRGWIEESVAGLTVRVPADSFVQVNDAGAGELAKLVVAMAGQPPGPSVLDLYGGIGLYGITLARQGARSVRICEADAAAVRAGRRAVRREFAGIEFVHGQVGRFLSRERPRADVVVANPPRAGMGPAARLLPATGARRIILVSCDPATLARDIAAIRDVSDYRATRVVPVDLFPQTAHVEAVALLERDAGSPTDGHPAPAD